MTGPTRAGIRQVSLTRETQAKSAKNPQGAGEDEWDDSHLFRVAPPANFMMITSTNNTVPAPQRIIRFCMRLSF